jgi:hypothetical protein
MSQRRGSAVICGASMGGLLAARALSDFYGSITIVERDVLPEAAVQRRGVSQGRHLHALLSRGSVVLAELFPGLFDELLASGANVIDGTDASVMCVQAGGHQLSRSGAFAHPEAFLRTLALIDPPSRLLRPSMLMRVVKGHRRRTNAAANGNTSAPLKPQTPAIASDTVTDGTVSDGQDPPSNPVGSCTGQLPAGTSANPGSPPSTTELNR